MNGKSIIKGVKAATKNKSIAITDVTRDDMSKILDATSASVTDLNNYTEIDGFDKYVVSYRNGEKVLNVDGSLELKPFSPQEKVISILTNRYALLEHKTVFNNLFNLMDENKINFEIAKVQVDQREGSNKIYAMLKLLGHEIDVDGSLISPTIDIYNSTDGTLSAGVLFGAYRVKCTNGMLIGEDFSLAKIIHSPSAIKKFNVEALFELGLSKYKHLISNIERMQSMQFNSEMLKELKMLGVSSMFLKHYDTILDKYMIEYREDVDKNTLWGFYATFTNFISNHLSLKSIRDGLYQQTLINNFINSKLGE
jgi:hypothetical protein